ncbi:MAG: C4-type zinc ribbon domain-containing protein [Myxococcales bacterium]|nr:C4-type zinc ribbon domain-containing protein [Myxococcales bacterium]
MQDELAALAAIAEIDAKAHAADTELAEIPVRMGELESDVARLAELLEAERTELKEVDALLSAQEEELQNQGSSLARSKAKSARARNLREADAVERELEVIRRSMKEREEGRVTLVAALDKRRGAVEKHEREFAELERFFKEEKEKADARVSELQARRAGILAGRADLEAKIPRQVLRRYERIREKRAGVGAVLLRMGICQGCNTSLPPNQAIAVQRGETFEQCPNCNRILFNGPTTAAESESETES